LLGFIAIECFFGVYLLIRKRAVLRYIYRLLAVYVCLLANIRVF